MLKFIPMKFCRVLLLAGLLFSSLDSSMNWGPIETLSSQGNLFSQNVVYNENGFGIAVWTDINDIFFATYQSSQWSKPKKIATGLAYSDLLISLNNKNEALLCTTATGSMAVGSFPETLQSAIYAFYFDGQNFSEPKVLATEGVGNLWSPVVKLNDNGLGMILWGNQTGYLSNVIYQNGSFSDRTILTQKANSQSLTYDIDLNNNGNALATWIDNRGVVQAKLATSSGWESETSNLSLANSIYDIAPVASIQNASHPMVLWSAQSEKDDCLLFSIFNDTWSICSEVGSYKTTQGVYCLDFSMNSNQEAIVLWGSSTGLMQASIFQYDDYSPSWGAPVTISTDCNPIAGVVVQLNEENKGVAVWAENGNQLNVAAYENQQWLLPPKTLSQSMKQQSSVQISYNNHGAALVAWINGENFSGPNVIQACSGSSSSLGNQSLGLKITKKENRGYFYSSYDVQINWSSTDNPKISSYALFQSDVLEKKLSADVLSYTLPYKNQFIVYRIDALDENGQVILSESAHAP